MFRKKLFGNNITIDCSYCQHYITENSEKICELGRTIKKGKCRKFNYNPTMRVPATKSNFSEFSPDDFKI